MNIPFRFRQPAPIARKVCKQCENRRALFRQEGIRKWDPYYALCYKCFQRYLTRAQAAPAAQDAGAVAGNRPHKTLVLETGLMPAQ